MHSPENFIGPLAMAMDPPKVIPFRRLQPLERFRESLSPPEGRPDFSEEILDAAAKISVAHPQFHERLLEALSQRPGRGSYQQATLVEALRILFRQSPLTTTTGNFKNGVLQLLIRKALTDPSPRRRNRALASIMPLLEEGPNPERILSVLSAFPYGERWHNPATEKYPKTFEARHGPHLRGMLPPIPKPLHWTVLNSIFFISGASTRKAARFLNIIYEARLSGEYDSSEMDSVIARAREHPLGQLIMDRMLRILAVQDIPDKLTELKAKGPTLEIKYLQRLIQGGVSPEIMVSMVRGTEHTAHIQDLRLAHKVVSVYRDILAQETPTPSISSGKSRLGEAIQAFLLTKQKLTPDILVQLAATNPTPQTRSLKRGFTKGKYNITLLKSGEFEQVFQRWGEVQHAEALYDPNRHQIYLLDIPQHRLSSPLRLQENILAIGNRLKALIHEWEHWRHCSGQFDGPEGILPPVDLKSPSRRERLVSEIMADLEEYRWRIRNYDDDIGNIVHHTGDTLAQFYRSLAEENYYAGMDQGKLRDQELLP